MRVTHTPAASAEAAHMVNFRRTARRVYAVLSQRLSSAVARIATSGHETASDYPRFPWF